MEFFLKEAILVFIVQYFIKRYSMVVVQGATSKWKADIIRIPQGGSLSPIEIINQYKGIQLVIFAVELCVYTNTKLASEKIILTIQYGILVIHWYSYWHRLKLNF